MIDSKDYIGKVFNSLIILEETEPVKLKNGKNKRRALCKCTCGKECITDFLRVIHGVIRSCGCFRLNPDRFKDYVRRDNKIEYSVYNGIKKRCYNKNSQDYPRYGGRGIKMHPDFLLPNGQGFKNFLECIGKRPEGKYSIDRENVYGDYECGNIRWATDKEQANNKTNNIYVTYRNETKTLAEWCEFLEKDYNRVQDRMTTYGWDFETAINTPVSGKGTNSLCCIFTKDQIQEIYKSAEEYKIISEKYKIKISCISRIKNRSRYREETEGLGQPGRSSSRFNPSRHKNSLHE